MTPRKRLTREQRAERQANLQAWREDVVLRPKVHYRKLQEYGIRELLSLVETLADQGTVVSGRTVGVTQEALLRIRQRGIQPIRVFALPDEVMRNPRLLGYYRRLSGTSLKSVKNLVGDPEPYELGRRRSLDATRARDFCRLFNEAISDFLIAEPGFSSEDIASMIWTACGSQIQGTWGNLKGNAAQQVVRDAITRYLAQGGYVANVILRDGTEIEARHLHRELEAAMPEVRAIILRNGVEIAFGAEPDIAIRDRSTTRGTGILLSVHEIKGGIDNAAALERSPAAMRSFTAARDPSRGGNIACHTALVAGTATAEMRRRLGQGGLVNGLYLLPRMVAEEDAMREYFEKEVLPYALR